jgi:hypothetical protein
MSVFCVAGMWLSFEASVMFQLLTGYQIAAAFALVSFVTSGLSLWEWREYGVSMNKKTLQYILILFLIICELGAVIFLWPIGYFMSSFFITWIWYLVWLMFRFDLSGTGIDWQKQRGFLIVNVVLMVIFLTAVVRWK